MSVLKHMAGSAVLVRENCNAPAVPSSLLAVARLCTASSNRAGLHRPIACPHLPLRFDNGGQASLFPHRSGRRLTPPASERPGRDHRKLGPSAGSSLYLRARPCRQASGRARVSAYSVNLPHSLRSSSTSARCREGMAQWGQRLTGTEQC